MHRTQNRTRARSAFNLQTKKSLGQHLLVDSLVVQRMCAASRMLWGNEDNHNRKCDEIGPGSGVLTLVFLENDWQVTSIERDPEAIAGLRSHVAPQYPARFSLVEQDILRWDPPVEDGLQPLLVGNIPYYITSDILLWLCQHRLRYRGAVLMMQKEVADRLEALPSTRTYGRLSVRLQLLFAVETLFIVPPGAFSPPPKVDSAVVLLSPRAEVSEILDDPNFDRFTALLFSARRKMLRRALARDLEGVSEPLLEAFWQALQRLQVRPEDRPETLAPDTIVAVYTLFRDLAPRWLQEEVGH